jgi:CRP-like cAMP-binding protein
MTDSSRRRAAQQWRPGSLLARLGPAADRLIALGQTRLVGNGHRVLTEGAGDTQVELIRAGFCKVSLTTADGHTALIAVRGPGDPVGELAALSGASRSATVEASGPVTLVTLSGPAFQRFVAEDATAAAEVTRTLGERLAWSNRRRADATLPGEVRLARLLAELADICGHRTPKGIELMVPLTQTELAGMIGAGLPTVQRALAAFRRDGLVRTGYRHIVIADPRRLARKMPDRRHQTDES